MALLRNRTHTSKINARHLLDDLVAAYTHPLEETVVVELVANSLDAGASSIEFSTDSDRQRLTVTDNGAGMTEAVFETYHDLAGTTKVRGKGIGFAGLGAKLAHMLASEVQTDTRSDTYSRGSDWSWSDEDLEWKERRSRLRHRGTQVSLSLNQSSSLLSPVWLERCLRKHYTPLFDPELARYYIASAVYPSGITFTINGKAVETRQPVESTETTVYRDVRRQRAKKPTGLGLFGLSTSDIPSDLRGVALATRGKVIKRDTLGMSPAKASRIYGLVEIPDLVECLTTTKQDFLEHGSLGQKCRRLKEAAQRVYSEWLSEIGENVGPDEVKRSPRTLARELAQIVKSVRELDYLHATTAAVKVAVRDDNGPNLAEELQGILFTGSESNGNSGEGETPTVNGPEEGSTLSENTSGTVESKPRQRRAPRGPEVKLIHAPEKDEMSWLSGDSVMINTAHPAYVKAQREGQTKAHQRVAALVALCEGASEENALDLLKRALATWGRN